MLTCERVPVDRSAPEDASLLTYDKGLAVLQRDMVPRPPFLFLILAYSLIRTPSVPSMSLPSVVSPVKVASLSSTSSSRWRGSKARSRSL